VDAYLQFLGGDPPIVPVRFEVPALGPHPRAAPQLVELRGRGPAWAALDRDKRRVGAAALDTGLDIELQRADERTLARGQVRLGRQADVAKLVKELEFHAAPAQ